MAVIRKRGSVTATIYDTVSITFLLVARNVIPAQLVRALPPGVDWLPRRPPVPPIVFER